MPDQQLRPGAPATPVTQRLPAITRNKFGLFPVRSPLLGESLLLSLPAGTEMFHFPALPPTALCIQAGATVHDDGRVSPFGNPRITARLPAPRGLSQAPTSFIGSWCLDIHRVLLETWLTLQMLDARVHCAVLKIRTGPHVLSPHPGTFRLGRSRSVALSEAAASSGPNSVLGAPAPARPRSAAVPENRAY